MSFVQSDIDALFGVDNYVQPQDEPNLEYPDDQRANWNHGVKIKLDLCLNNVGDCSMFNVNLVVRNILVN